MVNVSDVRDGNVFRYKVTKAESTAVAVELIQKILQFPDIDDAETETGIDTSPG